MVVQLHRRFPSNEIIISYILPWYFDHVCFGLRVMLNFQLRGLFNCSIDGLNRQTNCNCTNMLLHIVCDNFPPYQCYQTFKYLLTYLLPFFPREIWAQWWKNKHKYNIHSAWNTRIWVIGADAEHRLSYCDFSFIESKEGYYRLPVIHCGQTILSTAESQQETHFKVSPRRKHKGTREVQEIIQYTPRKLYRSYDRISRGSYRCTSQV